MERQMGWAAILVWLIGLAALAGCGGDKKVKITGKLMKNGQPLIVSRESQVTLGFIPDSEDANHPPLFAVFNRSTGGFEIQLRAGKYRVHYVILEKDKKALTAPPEQRDKSYDLTQDQELNIEIN